MIHPQRCKSVTVGWRKRTWWTNMTSDWFLDKTWVKPSPSEMACILIWTFYQCLTVSCFKTRCTWSKCIWSLHGQSQSTWHCRQSLQGKKCTTVIVKGRISKNRQCKSSVNDASSTNVGQWICMFVVGMHRVISVIIVQWICMFVVGMHRLISVKYWLVNMHVYGWIESPHVGWYCITWICMNLVPRSGSPVVKDD